MLLKVFRALGMILMLATFVIILGTAGSDDLGLLSFEQVLIRCTIAMTLGFVGFGIMWLTDIYEPTTTSTVKAEPTPEQIYIKCCGCPNFACNKTYQEVLECSNRKSLS